MDKQTIRKHMRQLNRSLTVEERADLSQQLFARVEQIDAFVRARCVAAFCALSDEPESREALLRWAQAGKRVVVPRVEGEEMHFYDFDPATLSAGAFGIAEPTADARRCAPSEIDLMIVPAVALTAAGDRLGRGKGYYDRYLAQSAFRAYTIGVGYRHQLLDRLPTEPHDHPLTQVVVYPDR